MDQVPGYKIKYCLSYLIDFIAKAYQVSGYKICFMNFYVLGNINMLSDWLKKKTLFIIFNRLHNMDTSSI